MVLWTYMTKTRDVESQGHGPATLVRRRYQSGVEEMIDVDDHIDDELQQGLLSICCVRSNNDNNKTKSITNPTDPFK